MPSPQPVQSCDHKEKSTGPELNNGPSFPRSQASRRPVAAKHYDTGGQVGPETDSIRS